MILEEGEILVHEDTTDNRDETLTTTASRYTTEDPSGKAYSSALEWPGDSEVDSNPQFSIGPDSSSSLANAPPSTPSLRLLVRHSTVLRKLKKLALLDGYSEIQIGRDVAPPGSETPRIRLKELEVSKLHATIFWDEERLEWAIVDMGSKHGTFIQPATLSSSGSSSVSSPGVAPGGAVAHGAGEKGIRLCPPRVASIPRPLHHLDLLTIGGTTFAVHVHEDRIPCAECSPQANEEVPLFSNTKSAGNIAESSKKRKLDAVAAPDIAPSRNPRAALAMLKRSLLSASASTSGSTPGSSAPQYVDRSARRRTLHPDHSPATTPNIERSRYSSPSISAPATPPPPTPVSAPSAPLPASNIGHRLLMKQGWQPGSALGDPSSDNSGLLTPLEPPSTVGRAGLGASVRPSSSTPAAQGEDWRDAGKQRRWAMARSSDHPP
ncbi:hypothetical protein TRAPUB_8299 [Trametes pubescens]|uniref:Angiogenic factor with G patch and FHA domains 1 n=1 Tax=Trametes pubescens TaxID=154538 RepID=A0A1M2W5L1_TRAPU|nr:hypothetical protein TRAPUB_8299 [Trametes pubescens]